MNMLECFRIYSWLTVEIKLSVVRVISSFLKKESSGVELHVWFYMMLYAENRGISLFDCWSNKQAKDLNVFDGGFNWLDGNEMPGVIIFEYWFSRFLIHFLDTQDNWDQSNSRIIGGWVGLV